MRTAIIHIGEPDADAVPVFGPSLATTLLATIAMADGHEADVLDGRLLTDEALLARLDDLSPDVVGLNFMSPVAERAMRLGAACRRSGRFVVMGGVHASICADALLERGACDTVVRGEGEVAWLRICRALADGVRPDAVIEGDPVADLADLPTLRSFACYREAVPRPTSVYVQLGRGCPSRCAFCNVPNRDAFRGGYRRRPIDLVLGDVRAAVEGPDRAEFVVVADSIATLRPEHALAFIDGMVDRFPAVGFMLNAHVKHFDERLAPALGRARDASVWFGFESGSQRLLDFLQKGTTVEQGRNAARLCREHGVAFGANLLLGVPGETAEDYAAHEAFMAEIRADQPNPNILTPLPGTAIHDFCLERDLLVDPADHVVWSAERIRKAGRGPIRGVDYERVLRLHDRLRAVADDAAGRGT